MSTFREHLKECGLTRAGAHHIDDCYKKGTCSKGGQILTGPFITGRSGGAKAYFDDKS